jgi:hypothetical protein
MLPAKCFTGRFLALILARLGREWRAAAAARMPEARGDIREIVGQPVFVPLYNLYLRYGKLFRLRCVPLHCGMPACPGGVLIGGWGRWFCVWVGGGMSSPGGRMLVLAAASWLEGFQDPEQPFTACRKSGQGDLVSTCSHFPLLPC